MSQISPPIRILLVAVIGLIAVYMLFLRPKTEEAVPAAAAPAATTTAPATDPNATTSSKPGSAVNQAVRGADSASARADAAAGGAVAETEGGTAPATTAAGTTATGTPAVTESGAPAPVTKETLQSLPKDVRRPVRRHKVLVLLFYNNRSSDDRAVRRALSKVDDYGGQVFVDAHWIKSVSRYQAIARGVDVEQSPTIVVADRNLKAETLVGYVDTETIDQAVVDALRASGGSLLKNPYFRKIDSACAAAKAEVKALPAPAGIATVPAYLGGVQQATVNLKTRASAIKPGKSRRAFHKAFVGYSADNVGIVAAGQLSLKANPTKGVATVKRMAKQGKALDKKFVAKHGAHGLSCF